MTPKLAAKTPKLAAKIVLNEFWDRKLPVNPVAIVYAMGGRIHYDPDLATDSLLQTDEKTGKPVIVLKPSATQAKQRAVFFHELCLYLLAQERGSRTECDPEETTPFITEMIMPEELVLYMANHTRMSIDEMAEKFQVPWKAVELRLQEMGILKY